MRWKNVIRTGTTITTAVNLNWNRLLAPNVTKTAISIKTATKEKAKTIKI